MTRIATALVLIPLVVWIVLAGPFPAFLLALTVVGTAAFWEFDAIAAQQGMARAGFVGLALGVALLLVPDRMAFPVVALAAPVLMTWAMRVNDLANAMRSAGAGVLGVIYIFGAWRCAVGLRAINPHWLMVALLVSWAGDTFAMYTGKLFGSRKLAPVISPGKTWEGAFGSVLGAMIAAGLYAHFWIELAPLWAVLLMAAAANIAGQVGDLAESAFKRGAGVKDSGWTLPGHGGWLDRIDSSLFAIPVVYGVFRLLLDLNP
jgi:phosphatidate cytidylyltransferase